MRISSPVWACPFSTVWARWATWTTAIRVDKAQAMSAIERAALSTSVLPDPGVGETSLYAQLEKTGNRPVRAIQRIRAANLAEGDAELLEIPAGAAALHIERIAYLASGKVVEFTRSVYRGDTYDFVAELRVGESARK